MVARGSLANGGFRAKKKVLWHETYAKCCSMNVVVRCRLLAQRAYVKLVSGDWKRQKLM